jgi:hypothetical protein
MDKEKVESPPQEFVDTIACLLMKHSPESRRDGYEEIAGEAWEWMKKHAASRSRWLVSERLPELLTDEQVEFIRHLRQDPPGETWRGVSQKFWDKWPDTCKDAGFTGTCQNLGKDLTRAAAFRVAGDFIAWEKTNA